MAAIELAITNPLALVVHVELSPVAAHRRALLKAKIAVSPVRGLMLVDTGAAHTTIDGEVVDNLQLPKVGASFHSSGPASGNPTWFQGTCPLRMEIWGRDPSVTGTHSATMVRYAVNGEFVQYKILGLLGMDLLRLGKLRYDGPRNVCELSW